ncbi:MAG: DM13 domain-containing protein [Candidatus Thiodiazotropha sp. (ex Ctena orbiculata)]|uniref:DM13 domain-containing protein n=1 Tax=Candidatus Thiodiazotropha taylori TaxID=2792791 RepID=A0A944M3F7_9GAMM|nr:DM13 domain-containing protein [Candidatus Thiodiazotropha taylori]MBV2138430.1 DM13 domain-containing protein [Candidatus Thiodiazotropha taylori]
MKIRNVALLFATHCAVGIAGFGAGIYALPILTAPPAPSEAKLKALMSSQAEYTGQFRKDLKDSDALHWGEGTVAVSSKYISLMGKLAPGPDYKLYLSPEYVETEADFNRLKINMVRVGDVKTFNNFIVDVPPTIDPSDFNSVIVWCESFGQFITSAKYR